MLPSARESLGRRIVDIHELFHKHFTGVLSYSQLNKYLEKSNGGKTTSFLFRALKKGNLDAIIAVAMLYQVGAYRALTTDRALRVIVTYTKTLAGKDTLVRNDILAFGCLTVVFLAIIREQHPTDIHEISKIEEKMFDVAVRCRKVDYEAAALSDYAFVSLNVALLSYIPPNEEDAVNPPEGREEILAAIWRRTTKDEGSKRFWIDTAFLLACH